MAEPRSAWMVPLSAAFAMSAGFTLVMVGTAPGCQTRCVSSNECGTQAFCNAEGRCETQCFTNEDCREPPDCRGNPSACECRGLLCNSSGKCVGRCVGAREGGSLEGPGASLPSELEGWDSAPGFGEAFIVETLAIADESVGFNIDGRCRGTGDCIDNSLWQLGQLGNDQIRQGLRSGETLLLVELAGLNDDFGRNGGNDDSLTVKFYGGRDADVPFFPANNFQTPPNGGDCCQFKINPQSVAGVPPQARARAPARLLRGRLESLVPVPIQFTLTVGVPPHPEIRIEKVLLSGRVAANLSRLSDGLIGGAVPVNTLAQTDNPYCKTLNSLCPRALPDSTLIDLIASILQPDVDLDIPPDGLELLQGGSDGRIERCYDGCAGGCMGQIIQPIDPMEPHTCALQPEIADGYSIGLLFEAVGAQILGVGQ
jgi:hypothetical protein